MKKVILLLMLTFLMVGCSSKNNDYTLMITRNNETYALYDQDGEKLTDYLYKTYEEIDKCGYIVTNDKDQKGLISYKGKELVPFGEYETMEIVDQMIYATKKVEIKKDTKKNDKKQESEKKEGVNQDFIHENLYVLNSEGKVLYEASQDVGIMRSGLPIIWNKNEYTILYKDGEEFQKTKEVIQYAYQSENSMFIVEGKENQTVFYDFSQTKDEPEEIIINEKGKFEIMCVDTFFNKNAVLYDSQLKELIYIDREELKYTTLDMDIKDVYYDLSQNIILKDKQSTYIYQPGGKAIKMNSYYQSSQIYVVHASAVYGPHIVYKDGKKMAELENCQVFSSGHLVLSDIFPVYTRNTGFQYYNFDGKLVNKNVYLDAEPFDSNLRAIVKINDQGYTLINQDGTDLLKKTYSHIQYIGNAYYAVYNKDNRYGVVDLDGNVVFPDEYTDLPQTSIFTFDNKEYALLGKNGRSYLYDLDDENKEIFSVEGHLTFHEKGYFVDGNKYYTIDGKIME